MKKKWSTPGLLLLTGSSTNGGGKRWTCADGVEGHETNWNPAGSNPSEWCILHSLSGSRVDPHIQPSQINNRIGPS